MFLFGLLNAGYRATLRIGKRGVEIELERQCVYSYEFHTVGNKGIC